jgi:hypothetical protein
MGKIEYISKSSRNASGDVLFDQKTVNEIQSIDKDIKELMKLK